MATVNFVGQAPDPWQPYGGAPNGPAQPPPASTPAPPPTPAPPTTPGTPTAPTAPPAFPTNGFGTQPWQQTPEGQQFFNHLKSLFPHLTDADLGANLNFDRMPDQRYQQELINNFARNTPKPKPTTAPTTPGGPQNGDYQGWFNSLIVGKPFNQQLLLDLEPILNQYGMKLTPPNTQGERTKIQLPDGTWVRVGFGEGHPVWVVQSGDGTTPPPSPPTAPTGGTQWNDPATQQLEDYAQQWLKELNSQHDQLAGQAGNFQSRQQQAQAATDRLVQFLQGRATQLQGPAFTGPQQEILRTQVLDPIERDRSAAKQRALERISARGMDPSSGIAQSLLNQVDNSFDTARAGVQNNLGVQEMQQEHANQQEAQQMLGLIPQTISAGNAGQLEFLQALNAAVNQPRQTGLPISSLIYDLPNQALQQSLAVLGIGPSPQGLFASALGAYNAQTQRQSSTPSWFEQLGALLPYLTR